MSLGEQTSPLNTAAFRECIADVNEGRFPERSHLVEMEAPFLDEVERAIGSGTADKKG